MTTIPGQKFNFRRLIFYIAGFLVAVIIYLRFVELEAVFKFSVQNFLWFLLILILQAGTYLFTALNYKYVLKMRGGADVPVRELFPLAFVIQFLNQAFPSAGLSGQIFFVDYLKKRGFTVAEGIGRAILELLTLFIAYGILFVAISFLILSTQILQESAEVRFLIYAFIFAAVLSLGLFLMIQSKLGSLFVDWVLGHVSQDRKFIHSVIREFYANLHLSFLRTVRVNFGLAILWQLMIFVLDIITLYILLLTFDTKVSFIVPLVAFPLTQFIASLSFVPGALGIFEGGMAFILISLGIASGTAIGATLILRALTFWMPMPIGWLWYRYYSHKRHVDA